MDWKRADTLLSADLDRLTSRAADPGATLRALGAKVAAQIEATELHLTATLAKVDTLPEALEGERAMLAKIDAVIVKAEGDGRADLAAAAGARKAKHVAKVAALEAELADVDAEIGRAEGYLERLSARADELSSKAAEATLASPPAAAEEEPEAVSDEGLGFDIAALDGLGSAPAPVAARKGPPKPATPVPDAAPAAGAGGGDDLDAEFAALLANMGEDVSASGPADDDGDQGVDDILAGLPELVQVADGELPEGADPDSDAPIDFSALDDLPAVKAAAAKAGEGKGKGKSGKAKKSLPAKVAGKAPAVAKGGDKASGADKASGSKKTIWIVVAGTVVAAGGTVAALFAFGVL